MKPKSGDIAFYFEEDIDYYPIEFEKTLTAQFSECFREQIK